MRFHRSALVFWLAVGAVGYLLVPWYALDASVFSAVWLRDFTAQKNASALVQVWQHGRTWLLPIGALLIASACLASHRLDRGVRAHALLVLGAAGFLYTFGQGFVIGAQGWSFEALARAWGPLAGNQLGMGLGAALTLSAFAMLFALGLAERGYFNGDAFIAGCIVAILASTAIFTFYPVLNIMVSAFEDDGGAFSLTAFFGRATQQKVWGLGCLTGGPRCGVAWNTLLLALICGAGTTALGLAFALVVARTNFRFKKLLRAMSILPIITPPFVIGLALILLFGRSGVLNHFLELSLGIEPSRWFYGLPGLILAQLLSFTPIAFLVLIGVVEGVSPSMEEAAQTLRANRWRTFIDVSLPLMRPGLANAFLIGFIESIADFGNPIVLGGNFGVLATEVFYSVVGAQLDQGRAAALGLILLGFALAAFFAQRWVLGRKVYTAMSGKGDSGLPTPLPDNVRKICYAAAIPWIILTLVIYAMVAVGGFVEQWGRNYTPTLKHYIKAFGVEAGANGLLWVGTAWASFWTTVKLSAIAAPVTAGAGPADRIHPDAASLPRPVRVRIRHLAQLRDPRHGDRCFLHSRVQRPADRDHGHRADPDRVQRVPKHARRCARRHGVDGADRQEPRRSLDDAGRARLHDAAPGPAAVAQAGDRRGAGLQLRALDDHGVGNRIPGVGGIRMGDHLHHQPRHQRRLWSVDRLLVGTDRADAADYLADPTRGRHPAARAAPGRGTERCGTIGRRLRRPQASGPCSI